MKPSKYNTVVKTDEFIQKRVFFCPGFLLEKLANHGTAGEQRGPSLFLSPTSARSRAFRHFFATCEMTITYFLIAKFLTDRLQLDEIYHLLELIIFLDQITYSSENFYIKLCDTLGSEWWVKKDICREYNIQ